MVYSLRCFYQIQVQSDLGVSPDDIARELELIDAKQHELEKKGRSLEQAIRNG